MLRDFYGIKPTHNGILKKYIRSLVSTGDWLCIPCTELWFIHLMSHNKRVMGSLKGSFKCDKDASWIVSKPVYQNAVDVTEAYAHPRRAWLLSCMHIFRGIYMAHFRGLVAPLMCITPDYTANWLLNVLMWVGFVLPLNIVDYFLIHRRHLCICINASITNILAITPCFEFIGRHQLKWLGQFVRMYLAICYCLCLQRMEVFL